MSTVYAVQPCVSTAWNAYSLLCFQGNPYPLIIVLQVQTANIRQKWSLLVISLLLYFRDNFGIYKDSEVVAWHCADISV